MKKPKRDRHSLGVAKSIANSYRPPAPDKVSKTVLVKKMRKKEKP